MYILKILTIFLLISSLNISIANTQSIELRESLKNTKAFYKEGKLKEAINETFKAIKLSKIDFGQEHYYTATLIENLGIIQYESLMYKDAEISFQEVLFIRKKILKEDHTDIAESLNFIALSNRKLQQYDTEFKSLAKYFIDSLFLLKKLEFLSKKIKITLF